VPEAAEFGGTEEVPPAFASVVLCGEPTPVLDGFVFTWPVLLAAPVVPAELEGIWLLSGGVVLDGAVLLDGGVELDGVWVLVPLLWSVVEVVLVVVVL
jgi:hypothetical protein